MASKAQLENALRNKALELIQTTFAREYETDVMEVSASELTIPVVDEEGNEKFILIKVSIPRGTRSNGTYEPYDGYAAHEEYMLDIESKAQEKAAKKAMKEAEKKKKEG